MNSRLKPVQAVCQSCEKSESPGLHDCPYRQELSGDPEHVDDYCNCCDECTHQCAMDI